MRIFPHPASSYLKLNSVGNIALGQHKGFAGNPDDLFVWSASSCRRQHVSQISNIRPNQSKIAIGKLKDVRASATTDRLRSIFVRIGAEPANKHGLRIHAAQ